MTDSALQELEELRERVASMRREIASLQQAHDERQTPAKKSTRKRAASSRAKAKEQLS